MQVLLTGKPCRNFQVLVAYSLLQMVREQVLQEGMAGDDILLVRVPFSQVQSHGSWGPQPPQHPRRRPQARRVLGFRALFAPGQEA